MNSPTMAVIGANRDRRRYSNKAVRAWTQRGYIVYPVNPNEDEVEGIKTFARVSDIPGPVDEATLYVRPSIGMRLLEELVAKGALKVYVNPGAESEELLAKAAQLGLDAVVACSVMAVGLNPSEMEE